MQPLADSLAGNYTMMQFFEWYAEGKGVHWKKFDERVDSLADMGITACWLPREYTLVCGLG